MSGNRRTLLLLGVAALAALFVWWRWGRSSSPSAADDQQAGGSTTRPATSQPGDRPNAIGATEDRGTPAMDPASGAIEIKPDGTRVYVNDQGGQVRDHRKNVTGEPTLFPAPLPPEQRTMNPKLTGAMLGKLRPMVAACTKDVPATDRGEKPIVMVTLTVEIAGGNMTTSDVHAGTLDIGADSRARVAECMRERAADVTLATPDEPDRTGYVVQFPIPVR